MLHCSKNPIRLPTATSEEDALLNLGMTIGGLEPGLSGPKALDVTILKYLDRMIIEKMTAASAS